MPLARFKDLCIDATDPARSSAFWSAVLGRRAEPDGDDAVIRGRTPSRTVWVNRVPEAKTVKNRVHLDIYAGSPQELEAMGARVVDRDGGGGKWTVMADPEDNEFCVFPRPDLPEERLHGLVVDSVDAVAAARWWAGVYGAEIEHHDDGWATLHQVPGMPVATMDFVAVPEPKTVKNRVHWDVTVAEISELVAGGATVLHPAGTHHWTVMADPEGNEFCVLRALPA